LEMKVAYATVTSARRIGDTDWPKCTLPVGVYEYAGDNELVSYMVAQ